MKLYNKFKSTILTLVLINFLVLSFSTLTFAAGTLTPDGSPDKEVKIRDHHINVIINNGFASTEVLQTFYNPNPNDLEGVYSFPVPKGSSLSEYTVYIGEKELHGEVVSKDKANRIYEQEKSKGNDTGVANKNSYQNFEFKVSKIPANSEVKIRFLYYQPIEMDSEVGKYLYPLEEGGTDEVAQSFWTMNSKVENNFSANIELRISYPISDIRIPGINADIKKDTESGYTSINFTQNEASLNKDIVLYYKLEDNLPGRLDVLTYKPAKDKTGTFMAVLTPGLDLKPLKNGVDWIFVLDNSGSMSGKIGTLVDGIKKTLGDLRQEDRYRVIFFNTSAREITSGWQNATQENITNTIYDIENIRPSGSTNIYDGLQLAFNNLDNDRVSSVVLVTDGVTNTGILSPVEFAKLSKTNDVRIFGYLLGSSANWPLMKAITHESGGFYRAVSNSDDIVGEIHLAKSKLLNESLHNAELKISGATELTGANIGKIYRGDQLVILGKYSKGGIKNIVLKASLSGEDKEYKTTINFPEVNTTYPELERIWALETIEQIQYEKSIGKLSSPESAEAIKDIGTQYQIVTDETSMLVLSDKLFEEHGIERKNQKRISTEKASKSIRRQAPVTHTRANKPMFNGRPANSVTSSGAGTVHPIMLIWGLGFIGFWFKSKK